jgi:hypothetical protein
VRLGSSQHRQVILPIATRNTELCKKDIALVIDGLVTLIVNRLQGESDVISSRSDDMELRDHPVMFCDGVRMCPPKWLQAYGSTTFSVSGEVGSLEAVFLSQVSIHKVYLLSRTTDGNTYIGTLFFEKPSLAKAVFEFLYAQIDKPLTSIGGMDFPVVVDD